MYIRGRPCMYTDRRPSTIYPSTIASLYYHQTGTKRTKVEVTTTLRVYMPIQWRPCTYTEVHPSISHLHEDCVESTQIKKWEIIPLP